jgi:hypothetical protein
MKILSNKEARDILSKRMENWENQHRDKLSDIADKIVDDFAMTGKVSQESRRLARRAVLTIINEVLTPHRKENENEKTDSKV